MNSFFVPALAGQIYAMPGMQTQLHALINRPGDYEGFSANYSGAGFSDMRFEFHGMSEADFSRWVQAAKASGQTLDREGYRVLERPSEHDAVQQYASVAPDLYDAIVARTVTDAALAPRAGAGARGRGGGRARGGRAGGA